MTTKRSIKLLFPALLILVAVLAFVATQNPQSVAADGANDSQSNRIVQVGTPEPEDGEEFELTDEEYPDPFQAAADTIGISIDALWDGLDNGKTVAELATDNGVALQTVIDAMVTAENVFIDQLLAEGEIDAAEAEEWRAEMVEYTTEMVNETLVNESFDDLYFDDPLDVAAETIGMDIDAFWEALDSGKTIADIATENNVDVQTVIDAMVVAEATFIDELLAEGDIDEAEADVWRAEVVEYTTEMVNESFDDLYFDEYFVDPLDVAAETIGMDIDAFWEALDSGKTIADIAAKNNVDVQTVIDAMVASENSFIDELLAAGDIDEAEAGGWRAEVVEYTIEMVNESWDYDAVELFLDEACVIEADGASLDQLDVPEGCLDGFAVFGATAAP